MKINQLLACPHDPYAQDLTRECGCPKTVVDSRSSAAYAQEANKYLRLHEILSKAYLQAAQGKGHERHAQGLPFHEQPLLSISRMIGSNHGLIYQACKKAQESVRMDKDAAIRELLGGINYLAAAVIFLEDKP